MNVNINKMLDDNKFGISEVKNLSTLFFEEEKMQLGEEKLNLTFSKGLHLYYGSNSYFVKSGELKIKVNVLKFLLAKGTVLDKTINLYNTVIHEVEHSKTFILAKNQTVYDFAHFVDFIEYISMIARYDVKEGNVNLLKFFTISRSIYLNHPIAISEIKSNLEAYKKTLENFGEYLSDSKKENYINIIDSLEFLDQNIEISIDENNKPRNKYIRIFKYLLPYVKSNPEILDEYKILRRLFDDKGDLKHIYILYNDITSENEEFMFRIITQMLLIFDFDLSEAIQDLNFKKYIENIVVKYNEKVIRSFKDTDKGKVFVDNKKLLSDNFKLQKQNVLYLKELTKKYDLKIDSGIVLDYKFGRNSKNNPEKEQKVKK